MKADGIEYEERMTLLEEITYPQPLGDSLRQALWTYRENHPVGARDRPLPQVASCATCTSRASTFTEFVAHYGIARSEGLVLRYLSDTYRALRQTVPDRLKTEELVDIIEWLGRDRPPDRLEPARRVGGADRPGVRRRRGRRGRRR